MNNSPQSNQCRPRFLSRSRFAGLRGAAGQLKCERTRRALCGLENIMTMKDEAQPDYILAHDHCTKNRTELSESEWCGCFYCLRIYNPSEIEDWIDNDDTAICAYCPV